MIKRIATVFINEIKPVEFCGKPILWQATCGIFEPPFEVEATLGEHDYKKCKNCLKTLEHLTKIFTEKFEGNEQKKGFPFCCPNHSNLIKVKEFDKALFENVPAMVARKIIYTNQHIINNHSSENWYKTITDYIEWVIISLGQMPNDCGEPFCGNDYIDNVIHLLKLNNEIKAETKASIVEYFKKYTAPSKKRNTDINILIDTYQKWFKIFPFELNSYFGNLKQYYENNLPILKGKPEINIYSGLASAELHTKYSLIKALINLTNNIITQINSSVLYEKGLITDTNKIKFDLIINERKLKLNEGYINKSTNEEQRYRNILKEWFRDEKEFINEITSLLKDIPPQPNGIKPANPIKLSDYFESISKFNFIMNLLVEKQYCQPNTFIWKDENKGNKGFLVAILKQLHSQGYYKNNFRLTNEQIKEIALNSFGWDVSIDTIKKTKTIHFDVSFIPIASTLN